MSMLSSFTKKFALIGSAALLVSSCSKKKESSEELILRFSAIPDKETTAQEARYKPVTDYLAKTLGVKVEFVPSSDYGASVEKFEGGDIQLAWFGGVTGVQAREAVAGAKAIASGKADLAFKSYFVANESTGMQRSDQFPAEIANLTFTYGSSSSTSGCIMPSHFIKENTGKDPMSFFQKKPLGFSGAHDKTALQVQDGTFQAGALSFGTYEKLVKAGKIDPQKCRVIWETPTYADYNFTAHPDLEKKFGEGFMDKLKKALLECKDEAALNALNRKELVEVTNDTFTPIAEVMKTISFK